MAYVVLAAVIGIVLNQNATIVDLNPWLYRVHIGKHPAELACRYDASAILALAGARNLKRRAAARAVLRLCRTVCGFRLHALFAHDENDGRYGKAAAPAGGTAFPVVKVKETACAVIVISAQVIPACAFITSATASVVVKLPTTSGLSISAPVPQDSPAASVKQNAQHTKKIAKALFFMRLSLLLILLLFYCTIRLFKYQFILMRNPIFIKIHCDPPIYSTVLQTLYLLDFHPNPFKI